MDPEDPTLRWLLEPSDPSTRYFALTDLLGLSPDDPQAQQTRKEIPQSRHVRDLLAGQQADGGFGCHPYTKWRGAHWRLVSLVALGISPGHTHCVAAAMQVLRWLTGKQHRQGILTTRGLTRRCASQEGNALGVCCCLGMAEDPRVQLLAESLVKWQWPDGGWNCDRRPQAHHSSFHESLKPMWGLLEYHRATGEPEALAAAKRTAELLLEHRLFRATSTGQVIDEEWTRLHWPAYWHYDLLGALDTLWLMAGAPADPRAAEALELLEAQRLPDGKWRHTGRRYWRSPDLKGAGTEATDWGSVREPSKRITLRALRILTTAGRKLRVGPIGE